MSISNMTNDKQHASQILTSSLSPPFQPIPQSLADTAQAFATATAGSSNPAEYIYSTILAIHELAIAHPSTLDHLLLTYAAAVKLYPATVTNDYGSGSDAGLMQLKWYLIDDVDGFAGAPFPTSIGTVDSKNMSNIHFRHQDPLNEVLETVEKFSRDSSSCILAAAMQARCFSFDIFRPDHGRCAAGTIDAALGKSRGWSKADWIGGCILLRGCAKSLIKMLDESEDADTDDVKSASKGYSEGKSDGQGPKVGNLPVWKVAFAKYLLDDDFGIKVHAAVKFHRSNAMKESFANNRDSSSYAT